MAGHNGLRLPSDGNVDVLGARHAGAARLDFRGHQPAAHPVRHGSALSGPDVHARAGLRERSADDHGERTGSTAAPIPIQNRFAAWSRSYLTALAGADAIIGGVAAAVPASISNSLTHLAPLFFLLGMLVWPIAIAVRQGYRRSRIGVGLDELRAVTRAGALVVLAAALPIGLLAAPDVEQPLVAYLKLIVTAVPSGIVLSLVARFVARKVLHRLQARGSGLRNVIVVGSAAAAQQLSGRIKAEPYCGMRVVGICLPPTELPRKVFDGIPVLGDLGQVAQIARTLGCDAVAVTSDDATRVNYLRELAWSLEGAGVELLVDPGLVEVAGPRMHIRPLIGFPLVHVEEPTFAGWRWILKRVSDVVLTCIGLVVASPLLLGIAAAVKLQDGGPVIFRQTRVGRGGEVFTMLKFRSMAVDAEARKSELMALNEGWGGLFKLRHDPRVTRLGRFLRTFSLDELPQLFNVLLGSMSLVGPRPYLAEELAQMPQEAIRRSLVTPGMTGLWQVSGRSDLQGTDAIRLDLRYVENWSLTLDLLILWKTASAVLARRGAH